MQESGCEHNSQHVSLPRRIESPTRVSSPDEACQRMPGRTSPKALGHRIEGTGSGTACESLFNVAGRPRCAYPKKRIHGGEFADWRVAVQSVPRSRSVWCDALLKRRAPASVIKYTYEQPRLPNEVAANIFNGARRILLNVSARVPDQTGRGGAKRLVQPRIEHGRKKYRWFVCRTLLFNPHWPPGTRGRLGPTALRCELTDPPNLFSHLLQAEAPMKEWG